MSDAITRKESLLKSIADGTSSSLKPITREEQYLAYIAGESNSFPTTPITREEAFLDKIAKRGAGGGGSSINVQPLTVTENGTWDAPEGQAYDPVIVDVKPITEPITITENGVYPVPKVSGGALDYGKEATFKNKITVEEITNYLDGVGFEIQTDATQSMLMYTLENGTLMIGWSNGVLIPQEAGYHIMVVPNEVEITGTGYTYLAGFPSYPDGGWYAINTIAGKIIPWATPITVAFTTPDPDRPYMATPNFELLSVFFDIETKSLDGWGDITVNVAGGGGAELNIAYGDTAPEDTSKLWVKTTQPSKVKVAKSAQYVELDNSATIETVAPLSVSTGNAIVGAVGSKIYVIGGFQMTSTYLDTIQCYDTETQTATTLSATVGTQISASAYATIGTKIYFAGGWYGNAISGIRCFDTETQTVTNLGHTEITRHGKCADAVGKKMYIFTETTDIYVYDTEADVLSKMSTTFPVSVQYKTARAVETKIYLVGGSGSNKIYCFDTETEVVTQLSTTLPSAIQGLGLAEHNGCLYVFGGQDASNTVLNTIHFIDVSHDTLSTLSTTLPNAIYRVGLAKVDDTIYIMGGLTSGTSSTPNVVSFVPGMVMAVATNELFILSALRNYFSIVKTDNIDVELGISGVFKGNADGIGEEVEASLHNGTSWVTI